MQSFQIQAGNTRQQVGQSADFLTVQIMVPPFVVCLSVWCVQCVALRLAPSSSTAPCTEEEMEAPSPLAQPASADRERERAVAWRLASVTGRFPRAAAAPHKLSHVSTLIHHKLIRKAQ